MTRYVKYRGRLVETGKKGNLLVATKPIADAADRRRTLEEGSVCTVGTPWWNPYGEWVTVTDEHGLQYTVSPERAAESTEPAEVYKSIQDALDGRLSVMKGGKVKIAGPKGTDGGALEEYGITIFSEGGVPQVKVASKRGQDGSWLLM